MDHKTLFIINCLLPIAVHSSENKQEGTIPLQIKSFNNFDEAFKNGATKQQRRFAKDFMNIRKEKILPTELFVKKVPFSEGGQASIHAAEDKDNRQYIVRKPKNGDNFDKDNPGKIERTLLEKMKQREIECYYLQGLYFITRNVARITESSNSRFNNLLVQERVKGNTLRDTVFNKLPPYSHGFPENLQKAVLSVATLASGIAAIHKAGFLHGDIFTRNVMLDENFICKIIDFGSSKKVDKSDEKAFRKDVHCLGYMSFYLLFGQCQGPKYFVVGINNGGLGEWSDKHENNLSFDSLYFKTPFLLELERSGDSIENFIDKKFDSYNEKMREVTGHAYPALVLSKLKKLIVKILSEDNFPFAAEISEEFSEIALIDLDASDKN